MATDDLVEAVLKRRNVERAGNAHGARHVVERIARLQLIQKPQPLLGK